MLEELHRCVLCGGKDFSLSRRIGDWYIQKCKECQLLFLSPRPTFQEYFTLYNTYWGYPPLPTDPEEKRSAIARQNPRVRRLERFKKPGALLDVGCGSGVFLACAREHGWDVWGVEIAKHCADYAREELGLRIAEGELHTLDFAQRFDVITLHQLLEHVRNPVELLLGSREKLQDDGLLIVEVPNVQSSEAFVEGKPWEGWGVPAHQFFFTPDTLRKILARCGFSILKLEISPTAQAMTAFARKDSRSPAVRLSTSQRPRTREDKERKVMSIETQSDIKEKWRHLDPIFIMGAQRSGTSVMAIALHRAGFIGFGEGHLWFELIEAFARFRDPEYRKVLKDERNALGAGRNVLLEKYIALAIDRFHRDNLRPDLVRWIDKSPGSVAVKAAPMLARMFPKSQFIFMYRNGITTVSSGMKLWADNPNIFQVMCHVWAENMSTWRKVRSSLEGRYIEIAQEEMAGNPEETAARLTDFLHIPKHRETIAQLFRTRRPNTAFPDKAPGDYSYEIHWTDKQRAFFLETCREEMDAWGYVVDFTHPVGPSSEGPTKRKS